jgi:hypothetical protein
VTRDVVATQYSVLSQKHSQHDSNHAQFVLLGCEY